MQADQQWYRFAPGKLLRIAQLRGAIFFPVITLVGIFSVCAILADVSGIVGTNDGSHYALTRALAADHTARIDPYVRYTAIDAATVGKTTADGYLYLDLSLKDGHFYSDRPPGTAFLATPLYWFGMFAASISDGDDLGLPQRGTMLLPPILGALTAAALYALARGLGTSRGAAFFTAASGVLTTLLFKYSTLLYSHIGAALSVTAALALLFAAEQHPHRRRWLLIASGTTLGYGAVVEYPNLLFIVPLVSYLCWRIYRRHDDAPTWGDLVAYGASWLGAILPLLGYNWAVFGRPWHTSYTYQYYFEWSHQLVTTYVTPPWIGLPWLLLGPSGIFVTTPACFLSVWGLVLLARRSRAQALLLGSIILLIVLPTSAHRTFYGGGSNDVRYLVVIIPVLYAPLGLWIDAVTRIQNPAQRRLLLALAATPICWGLALAIASLPAVRG